VTAIYQPIRFCPNCGTDLQKTIKRHRDRFDHEALAAAKREEL
jgi:hypothetical protein